MSPTNSSSTSLKDPKREPPKMNPMTTLGKLGDYWLVIGRFHFLDPLGGLGLQE